MRQWDPAPERNEASRSVQRQTKTVAELGRRDRDRLDPAQVLTLQRLAGNRATTSVVVQREAQEGAAEQKDNEEAEVGKVKTGDFMQVSIPGTNIPHLAGVVPLNGSGSDLVKGRQTVRVGDELPRHLRVPLPYTFGPFVVPGLGMLTFTYFPDQTLPNATGNPTLLTGHGSPLCHFNVMQPAMMMTPGGPIPDSDGHKVGYANFISLP
jgi:hypothetical protein